MFSIAAAQSAASKYFPSVSFSEIYHSVVGFKFVMKSTVYRIILINYFPTILMVCSANMVQNERLSETDPASPPVL